MHLDTAHDDFEPRMDWSLWRKVLRFARPYKGWFVAMSFVALLTAACDVAVLILPGMIIDYAAGGGSAAGLWTYGYAYAAVMLLFTACIVSFILIAGVIATRTQYDIRAASFHKLQELSFSYFDRRPIGWLMARLTSDCASLSRIIGWALLDIVWGTALILGVAAVMLYLNWKLALAVLAVVPPLLVVCRYYQVRMLVTSRKVRKANSHVTASFNEGITGVRTSKSLVREGQNLREFQDTSREMYDHSVRNALYAAAFLPWVMSLCSFGVGLALWLGGVQVREGPLTLGTLVIFFNCVGQLSNPVQDLARTLTMIQGAQASAERIQGLLDTEPEVKETPDALAAIERQRCLSGATGGSPASADPGKAARAGEPPVAPDGYPSRIGTIEFRDVGFAYQGGKPVLEHFNLTVEAGQTVALVGPTGGGKSTIVALLCRFYEPTSGRVLIDGVDYRRRSLHWLQSQLGIVLQTAFLFSGSVRDNIRYGRLDATDAEIEAAARTVNAHGFIEKLPGRHSDSPEASGYDASVGEGGIKLSTGQKQLIAMARAILADPQILVMDEATSSVDTETERLIQAAVERVLEGRIAFVIAHRLSTIRSADRILVIERGGIVEDGTHEELLALGGRYHELYTHQFVDEQAQEVLGARG